MKKIYKNENKGNKLKILEEKLKSKNLTDEIEMKEMKIKDINKKLKEIKSNSLKEFVYANRVIPESWKNKLNYQGQVLELFVKDKNFLSYVGNTGNENDSNKTKSKSTKIKFKLKNNDKPISFKSKSKADVIDLNDDNYRDSIPSTRNYSTINIKNKLKRLKNKTLDEKQLNSILNELKNNYPFNDKLKELFSEKILKTIDMRNKTINIKNNNKNKSIFKAEKRRNIFRQNIFVNLIPSKTYKPRRIQSAFMKNEYKKDNNIYIKKKYNILNENILNQLESINFFGPYYSYCPPCGNRNIDFYKNLDKKKLVEIVQQIKKMRGKNNIGNITERANMNVDRIQL